MVKALRGVCIGIDKHLCAGDIVDLDAAMVTFLKGIGAVEDYVAPIQLESKSDDVPASAGKKEKLNVA